MDPNTGNYAQPWTAMFPMNPDPSSFAHHGLPMDLHISQGFSYYRYRDDPFGWNHDRKPVIDAQAQAVNSRILELRKEKSRDAARTRRGKENFEFYELAKLLPLPAAITSQLDKASIIRLTISYLKLRDFSQHGEPIWTRENKALNKILKNNSMSRRTSASLSLELFEQHQGTHILQSLDGFVLTLNNDGRFLYISETVSIYLGLSQVEMTGSSIFEYIHENDHCELTEQLGLSVTTNNNNTTTNSGMTSPSSFNEETTVASLMTLNGSNYKGFDRAFCVRMKSTLTKRGCHFKSSGYRVVLLLCKLRPQQNMNQKKSQVNPLGLTALAVALPPPSIHEIRLECDMFVMRVNFDLRIAHSEPKITELLDYTPDEIVGESLYSLCHAEDAAMLKKAHSDLITKGQVLTYYYRVMCKNGGYIWIQTCATVVCSSKGNDEQNIICVNYVITGRENVNFIVDECQLGIIKREPIVYPKVEKLSDSPKSIIEDKNNDERVKAEDESSTSGKRGRKRKMKNETKDNSSPDTNKINSQSHSEVRQLENVMSKHLPKNEDSNFIDTPDEQQQQRQAINNDNKNHTIHFGHDNLTPPMPATALLRQLYASRESVIRATTKPGGGNFMLPDTSSHQSNEFDYLRKGEGFGSFVSSYGTYPSMDYHNAMTPPSSVSPRDLTNHKSTRNSCEYINLTSSSSSTDERLQAQNHNNDTTNSTLPVKPHPYPVHQIDTSSYGLDHQSQYFPYHTGFHLYKSHHVYTPP